MNDRIEIVSGVEGPCVVINSVRVAGPKPWGGGQTVASWAVDREELLRALPEHPDRQRERDEFNMTAPPGEVCLGWPDVIDEECEGGER